MHDLLQLVVGFLIGIVSGIVSGAFGIGGATIKIPLLRVLLGLSGEVAIATALPLSIPAALAGVFVYSKHKLIKKKTTIATGLVGSVFAVLGAIATTYVSGEFLMAIIAVLLLGLGYIILKEKKGAMVGDINIAACMPMKEKIAFTIVIGMLAGFSSGFLGIGGGVILVPLLVQLRKMPYKHAIACSLSIMMIYVIPASLTHFALGNVNVPIFVALLLGSAGGAFLGAKKVIGTKEKKVRKWFGITLLFFGILLLLNELGVIQFFVAGH